MNELICTDTRYIDNFDRFFLLTMLRVRVAEVFAFLRKSDEELIKECQQYMQLLAPVECKETCERSSSLDALNGKRISHATKNVKKNRKECKVKESQQLKFGNNSERLDLKKRSPSYITSQITLTKSVKKDYGLLGKDDITNIGGSCKKLSETDAKNLNKLTTVIDNENDIFPNDTPLSGAHLYTTQQVSKPSLCDENGWTAVLRKPVQKSKKVSLLIPFDAKSRVIGYGGSTIKSIQEASGAQVQVDKQNHRCKINHSTISILGSAEGVETARDMINSIVMQHTGEHICKREDKPSSSKMICHRRKNISLPDFQVSLGGSSSTTSSVIQSSKTLNRSGGLVARQLFSDADTVKTFSSTRSCPVNIKNSKPSDLVKEKCSSSFLYPKAHSSIEDKSLDESGKFSDYSPFNVSSFSEVAERVLYRRNNKKQNFASVTAKNVSSLFSETHSCGNITETEQGPWPNNELLAKAPGYKLLSKVAPVCGEISIPVSATEIGLASINCDDNEAADDSSDLTTIAKSKQDQFSWNEHPSTEMHAQVSSNHIAIGYNQFQQKAEIKNLTSHRPCSSSHSVIKESYALPTGPEKLPTNVIHKQPMTLPKIKSLLNPDAPDFTWKCETRPEETNSMYNTQNKREASVLSASAIDFQSLSTGALENTDDGAMIRSSKFDDSWEFLPIYEFPLSNNSCFQKQTVNFHTFGESGQTDGAFCGWPDCTAEQAYNSPRRHFHEFDGSWTDLGSIWKASSAEQAIF